MYEVELLKIRTNFLLSMILNFCVTTKGFQNSAFFLNYNLRKNQKDENIFIKQVLPIYAQLPREHLSFSEELEDFALHSSRNSVLSTVIKCLYDSAIDLASGQRILRVHLRVPTKIDSHGPKSPMTSLSSFSFPRTTRNGKNREHGSASAKDHSLSIYKLREI